MTNELREAAERLRRIEREFADSVYSDRPVGVTIREAIQDDRLTLANAYLAEHPSDDGEPVTREWLAENCERVLEGIDKGFYEWRINACATLCISMRRVAIFVEYEEIELPPAKTIGDVRRLVKALIPRKAS